LAALPTPRVEGGVARLYVDVRNDDSAPHSLTLAGGFRFSRTTCAIPASVCSSASRDGVAGLLEPLGKGVDESRGGERRQRRRLEARVDKRLEETKGRPPVVNLAATMCLERSEERR